MKSQVGVNTPIEKILKKLDMIPSHLADKLGLDRSTVAKWRVLKKNRGTGGLIPQRYHRPILNIAKEEGVSLSAEDFLAL